MVSQRESVVRLPERVLSQRKRRYCLRALWRSNVRHIGRDDRANRPACIVVEICQRKETTADRIISISSSSNLAEKIYCQIEIANNREASINENDEKKLNVMSVAKIVNIAAHAGAIAYLFWCE